MTLLWTGEESVHLFLRVSDDRPEDCPDNASDQIISDAVVLRALSASGEETALAIFPHREGERSVLRVVPDAPEREWPVVEGIEFAARHHNAYPEIQLIEMAIPLDLWIGEQWRDGVPVRVNIEVLDNDGRRFTSVRSWAPRWGSAAWVQLIFG